MDHRLVHLPVQSIEPVDIFRILIVLVEAAIFGLVRAQCGKITLRCEGHSSQGFSSLLILSAFLFDDVCRDSEPHCSIEPPPFVSLGLVFLRKKPGVAISSDNVVPQEACCLCGSMGNQGLFLREFQLECLMQVGSEAFLDLFCLFFCTDKSDECIIGIADIVQPSVGGIVRIASGEFTYPFSDTLGGGDWPFLLYTSWLL